MKTPEQIAEAVVDGYSDHVHRIDVQAAVEAGIRADRAQRSENASDRADAIATENYGQEGNAEAYSFAANYIALDDTIDPSPRDLIAAALSIGHLDADGILAMMREAAR